MMKYKQASPQEGAKRRLHRDLFTHDRSAPRAKVALLKELLKDKLSYADYKILADYIGNMAQLYENIISRLELGI